MVAFINVELNGIRVQSNSYSKMSAAFFEIVRMHNQLLNGLSAVKLVNILGPNQNLVPLGPCRLTYQTGHKHPNFFIICT
jgi:hypothetical protein